MAFELKCPTCRGVFRPAAPRFFHAGFGNEGFLYCDRDTSILVFSSYNRSYTQLVGDKHPWMLSANEQGFVEGHLKPCPCGGSFLFKNPPRCPHCGASIASLLPSKIYYVVVDRIIDGNGEDVWTSTTRLVGK